MGSTTGGVQGASFGVSVGSTWNDTGCDRRYNAQMLDALGAKLAALALMCMEPSVREAMQVAGTPCPNNKPAATPTAAGKVSEAPTYTDPLVRKRLGLAPL
jgi:hypothetical protein